MPTTVDERLVVVLVRSACQILLPILSGVLVAASFPPFDLWWLAWVALVPLGLSVAMSNRLLEPLAGALLGGATLHLIALDWVRTSYESSGVSGPWAFAWLAVAIALSPAWCVVVIVMHVLYHRFAATAAVALALGWMLGDLARRAIALLLTEMDFPWLQLAATQTHWPALVQAADLFGASGISVLIALVNGSICDAVLAHERGAKVRAVGVALVVMVLVLAYGRYRLSQPVLRAGPRIAMMPDYYHSSTSGEVLQVRGKADIVVWPEGAIQDDEVADTERVTQFEASAQDFDALVVIGWYRKRPTFTGNSMAIAHPRDGLLDVYEKTYLVPWTEFMPTVGIQMVARSGRHRRAGSHHRTFAYAGCRIAPAICYDACFPGLYRLYDSPDVFVVCSAEGADQTGAMSEHIMQMVRLRAIEFRRAIVRNVQDGHSGIIDSCGRVVADIPHVGEPVVIGSVPIDQRQSIYAVFGDGGLVVLLLLLVAVCLVRMRMQRWPQDCVSDKVGMVGRPARLSSRI